MIWQPHHGQASSNSLNEEQSNLGTRVYYQHLFTLYCKQLFLVLCILFKYSDFRLHSWFWCGEELETPFTLLRGTAKLKCLILQDASRSKLRVVQSTLHTLLHVATHNLFFILIRINCVPTCPKYLPSNKRCQNQNRNWFN